MAWSTIGEKKGEKKRMARNRIAEMHPSGEDPSSNTSSTKKLENESAADKNKDLHSGMELLELDFLLSIVENSKGNDHNDVAMRKLNFNELLRRQEQNHIDGNALAVYAVNAENLYGKVIQCEAMKELTRRTEE